MTKVMAFKSDFDRDFAWAGSKADETFQVKMVK